MTDFAITVRDRAVTVDRRPTVVVSGSVNIYTMSVSIDDAWDGYTCRAVFRCGSELREALIVDGACAVPWEALAANGSLYIGVYGINGDKRMPTCWTSERIYVAPGTVTADASQDPSPTVFEELVAHTADNRAAAEAARDAAETAKTEAQAAETNAETAQTAAETARTGAQTAETNAGTYATHAGNSATAAAGSATDAQSAQTAAESARDTAVTAKTAAETARDAASSSKTAAATSESNAALSASAAATSETNAASSAQAAANSAASLVVVNDLVTGGTSNALSAEQGKTLKGLVDENSASISELQVAVTDERDSKEYSKALSVTADGFLKLELTEIIGG